MKDLHIIIVSWNIRADLERCLKSLPEACEDLDWECVVVDNNSQDDSVEMIKHVFAGEDRIDLLVNHHNLGFAAACNQGAVQHKARYVLLLNPDTVCPPRSLTDLVQKMEFNPNAGIMGPKLLNHDGTYQQSVRRFPTLLNQILILLKLHHLLPWLPPLKKYFADDIDPNKPQSVDQVMGACFLVRAGCWDEMHGLDGRYFIWFEEVDACKTAQKNNWLVLYEPSVAVMHHGGRAFAKAFTVKKQRYFNDSLRKYILKWHGRTAWLLITLIHPIALFLALGVSVFKKIKSKFSNEDVFISQKPNERIKKFDLKKVPKKIIDLSCRRDVRDIYFWLGGIFLLEFLSFATLHTTLLRSALTVIVAVVVAILAYKQPAKALAIVGAELWIGGFGYLFAIAMPGLEMGLSLRMALMAGFGVGWGINALKSQIWRFWRLTELFIVQIWVLVAIMILAGLFNGLLRGQPFIIQDANAWAFLLYFIPVLDIAHRYKNNLIRHIKAAFVASVIYLPIKALIIFYIFSHGIILLADPLYTWIRDTRVGEITPAGGNVFRVFFQSAIYSVITGFFLVAFWVQQNFKQPAKNQANDPQKYSDFSLAPCYVPRYAIGFLWVLSVSMILLSLSRSFWVGTFAGVLTVFILSIIKIKNFPWTAFLKSGAGAIGALLILAGILYFPFPKVGDVSLASMLKDRGTVTDAAGSSRWNLLPAMWSKIVADPIIGSGFGSTVTYQSQDPRVLKDNPDGNYTTYAFEWGWLSLWIKFGIFGPLIIALLIVSLAWRTWQSKYDWWIRTGVISTLVGIATIHIFTPYLDHPLGFVVLLALEGMLAIDRENQLSNKN
ncbi:MAG: glycosyltransferase [Patescibacteria group bacterium]|nr:glycosyltransferase [Patescibacteria group bacterium]